jgi:hypothetical protein
MIVFPILGLQASLGQNLKLALVVTGVSIARSYALRRLFETVRRLRRNRARAWRARQLKKAFVLGAAAINTGAHTLGRDGCGAQTHVGT